MNELLTKAQIVDLVTRLYNGEGSEEEAGEWINLLQRNVPHPDISNLIFGRKKILHLRKSLKRH